jgi:outer membrane immunogenic protein
MFGRVILAAASVIALTAGASAADLKPAPAAASYKDTPYYGVNWSGMYVGVNGGYGWDESNIASKIPANLGVSPEGGFGGGQIGVNWQQGSIVFGLEADLQAAGITGSKSQVLPPNAPANMGLTLGDKSTLDWFGTVRGRIGYAFDRNLVYATGGLAYGHITDQTSCSPGAQAQFSCPITGFGKQETDAAGYVLGGGVEHKFNATWSAKAEYQYIDLGKDSLFAKQANEDYAVSTVRAGLNYHVGGGYEPLK